MDAATAITAAAALIALVALYFTGQQVKVAKQQTGLQQKLHEDAAQPYVWADLRPTDGDGHIMLLVVRNEGPTVATNVQIAFDPPVPTRWDANKDEDARASITLASMPPGRQLAWYVGVGPAWFDSKGVKRFAITINHDGPYGSVPALEYALDFHDFAETAVQPAGTLNGVTKAVKELTKQLKDQARRRPPPAR